MLPNKQARLPWQGTKIPSGDRMEKSVLAWCSQ